MKKVILASLLTISFWGAAQKSDNTYIYEQPSETEMKADDDFPSGPTDPAAPIDEYIPLLMAAAAGLALMYGKNKKVYN